MAGSRIRVLHALACYCLFGGCIGLMCGYMRGFTGFNATDLMLFEPSFGLKQCFGIGIGLTVLCFGGISVFMVVPLVKLHFIVTFPLLFASIGFLILFGYTTHEDRLKEVWDPSWDSTLVKVENMQMRYGCCGWHHSTDRGLEPCPYDFMSGCSAIVSVHFGRILRDVFRTGCTSLLLTLVATVYMIWFVRRHPGISPLSFIRHV